MIGDSMDCILSSLDDFHRTWLGITLAVVGIFGSAVNGWLMSTLLISGQPTSPTSMILLNLSIGCLGRSLLGGFPFAATSLLVGRWLFGDACCQLFAFLRQFFGVAQLASLALLGVERLVVSRHPVQERRLSVRLYLLGVVSCWLAAITWSVPPLLGVGKYSCDVTGLACDLDWSRTSNVYHLGFNIALLSVGNIFPVMITIICVWRALGSKKSSESKTGILIHQDKLAQDDGHSLNKTALALTASLFMLWLPQAILALWTFSEQRTAQFPIALVVLAPLGSEVSALVPVLVYLSCEPGMSHALLGSTPPKHRRQRPRKRKREGKEVKFSVV